MPNSSAQLEKLKRALQDCDALVIGAGSGLSTSAGFLYDGERFTKYFGDFYKKYGFSDMYSGGFYPYGSLEEYWAFWSRDIYINRYMDAPKPTYRTLLRLAEGKDYFVLTTNVDHCFQKAGFDKKRLFYTQGDYGLFQCSGPCHDRTYDNEAIVREMVRSQGITIQADGSLTLPETGLKTEIPPELVPHCPHCGKPMTMNLRCDDTFVQDAGWHDAAQRYQEFLRRHEGMKLLFLELGVGYNTPGIIKYPFLRITAKNPKATYACVNKGQAITMEEIQDRSICIDGDIGGVLEALLEKNG